MKHIIHTFLAVLALHGINSNAQNEAPATPPAETQGAADLVEVAKSLEEELKVAATLPEAETAVLKALNKGLPKVRVEAIVLQAVAFNPLVSGVTILQVEPDGLLGGSQPASGSKKGGDNETDDTVDGPTLTEGDGQVPIRDEVSDGGPTLTGGDGQVPIGDEVSDGGPTLTGGDGQVPIGDEVSNSEPTLTGGDGQVRIGDDGRFGGSTLTGGDGQVPVGGGDISNTGSTYN